jgi:protein-disulfide isomerase
MNQARAQAFRWRFTLDGVAALTAIGAALALLAGERIEQKAATRTALAVPDQPISIQGAPLSGSTEAEVVMIAYTDFECPASRRFVREILPELRRDYVRTGRLSVAHEHLPLAIHRGAVKAAVGANCARNQGRFWEMHDALFGDGVALNDWGLSAVARSVGLDATRFVSCLQDQVNEAAVRNRAAFHESLGLKGTPSFFIGRRLPDNNVEVFGAISGLLPVAQFRKAIDRTLQHQQSRRS